jgi:hypothetical protein
MNIQNEAIKFINSIAVEASVKNTATEAAFSYIEAVSTLNTIAHDQLIKCLPDSNVSKVMFLTIVLNLMLSCKMALDEETVEQLNTDYEAIKNSLNNSIN